MKKKLSQEFMNLSLRDLRKTIVLVSRFRSKLKALEFYLRMQLGSMIEKKKGRKRPSRDRHEVD